MTRPEQIGFIGLGMMGTPMAQCLARAGFSVYVADADPEKVTSLTGQSGIMALDSEKASTLDVLITMLPNSAIVERVLLGDDGWARHLPKGAVVIDMSSSEPAKSRDLAVTLAEPGLQYLDAPVSGGVKRAVEGKLAILVGGSDVTLERCRALFDAMGTSVLHIGAAGSGHAAKALNNYVSAAGLAATVEALHVAKAFGIDPASMTDVLNASSGRTNTSENKVKQFMLNGTFASGFALQLMNKDLKIAHALAQSVGYQMQLGDTCVALWNEAAAHSTPATDHTEMYRLLEKES